MGISDRWRRASKAWISPNLRDDLDAERRAELLLAFAVPVMAAALVRGVSLFIAGLVVQGILAAFVAAWTAIGLVVLRRRGSLSSGIC